MPRKPAPKTKVDSIRHQDKRANIPTEELRDFMEDQETTPARMLYLRDPSLNPQLVWKEKDEEVDDPWDAQRTIRSGLGFSS